MKRELISSRSPFEEIIGFSRAVRVGPFISVGGTAPLDEDGKTVGVGEIGIQTRRCVEIIKDALEQAGSGLHDVVRTRIMLARIEDWESVVKIRAEYFKEIKSVHTIVQVSRFINPEWLIEIEADAIVSG